MNDFLLLERPLVANNRETVRAAIANLAPRCATRYLVRMIRKAGSFLGLAVAVAACTSSTAPVPRVAIAPAKRPSQHPAPLTQKPDETVVSVTERPARKVGDFFVHRFSGKFNAKPVTLTEQVVGVEGDLLVVDFVLEEGDKMTALRARMRPDSNNDVVSIARIGGDKESPASMADYEALMAKTVFAPDENESKIDSETTTCLVGEKELPCEKTTYRVRVGDKTGVLSIMTSTEVPGRDIGGEVTGEDGSVLYRAELVEMGNTGMASMAAMADPQPATDFQPDSL